MATAETRRFLTIEEALAVVLSMGLQCSEDRMRRMARDRELPFFKDGRRNYIAEDELRAHYNRRQREAAVGAQASMTGAIPASAKR